MPPPSLTLFKLITFTYWYKGVIFDIEWYLVSINFSLNIGFCHIQDRIFLRIFVNKLANIFFWFFFIIFSWNVWFTGTVQWKKLQVFIPWSPINLNKNLDPGRIGIAGAMNGLLWTVILIVTWSRSAFLKFVIRWK